MPLSYLSTDRTGRSPFTAAYGGDKLAASPIGESGLVEGEAIRAIPASRDAPAILPDRSNRFVYAATLGANQALQFTFDSKTGKLTPNDPPAVSPEPGPRHMVSPDNKNRRFQQGDLWPSKAQVPRRRMPASLGVRPRRPPQRSR
jgi:6-phosphogluconolactonase